MKKIIVSIIVIGLLLTTSIATVNVVNSKACRPFIYVDDDALPEWYDETHVKTINGGMEVAEDGDTVYVFSGTYAEQLYIDKSINLIGEDRDSTIVKQSVYLSASQITVRRFSMSRAWIYRSNCTFSENKVADSPGFSAAINVIDSHCNIIGNIVTNVSSRYTSSSTAIDVRGSHCNISGNTVTNVGGTTWATAIDVAGSHCNITGNTVTNVSGITWATAIDVWDIDGMGTHCNISGNVVTNVSVSDEDGGWATAISVSDRESQYNIIAGNTVTNVRTSGLGWAKAIDVTGPNYNITGNTIADLNGGRTVGISYFRSSNFTIAENTITNLNGLESNGIYVGEGEPSSNTIIDNDISDIPGDLSKGIYISGDSTTPSMEYKITILGNTISNCGYSCIFLVRSHFSTIKENTIIGKWPNDNNLGITLGAFVTNTAISENTIVNNSRGLYLSIGCKKNIVSKNTITNNGEGIGMGRGPNDKGYASNNEIIGNHITDTYRYGIYCEEGSLNNNIYYNNFINNGKSSGAGNAYDVGVVNTWYKFKPFGKSMGNYWDDYTGQDSDGDGIGDTPYKIPGKTIQSKDWYPVMDPFDIENLEVSSYEMTVEKSEYLAQLEETINSQILSGELIINDLMNSHMSIVSTPSNTPTNN